MKEALTSFEIPKKINRIGKEMNEKTNWSKLKQKRTKKQNKTKIFSMEYKN